MGRREIYGPEAKFRLSTSEETTALHPKGDRRAIVQLLVDRGGVLTLEQINRHFGYQMRPRVMKLIVAGWVELIPVPVRVPKNKPNGEPIE